MSKFTFSSTEPNPKHPDIFDVSSDEVFANKENLCLIDVRRPDEYTGELGHAPGADLITLDTLPENLDKLPKDKTIVFICRSGARSGTAAALCKENGWEDVFNLKGGMIQWNQTGLQVEGQNS